MDFLLKMNLKKILISFPVYFINNKSIMKYFYVNSIETLEQVKDY